MWPIGSSKCSQNSNYKGGEEEEEGEEERQPVQTIGLTYVLKEKMYR